MKNINKRNLRERKSSLKKHIKLLMNKIKYLSVALNNAIYELNEIEKRLKQKKTGTHENYFKKATILDLTKIS